jgi:hypothetical protein
MEKEKNISAIKKSLVLMIFSAVLALVFFAQVIKANTPDSPLPSDPGANIGLVLQGIDLADSNFPKVYWTTYGNTPVYYWAQISESSDFAVKVLDTGQQAGNPKSYTISSGLVAGHSYYVRVSVKDNYSWTPWTCPVTGSFTYSPNNPPSVSNLSSAADYCLSATTRTFSWNYSDPDGDPQSAYQVQVDDNSDFSSLVVDSGKVYSSFTSFATTALSLNKTYYWRLNVWDSRDLASSWTLGPNFTTPAHAYPTPNFEWFPDIPTVGGDTLFSDRSTAYGGASVASWQWTIPDANYISPSTSASQSPVVNFVSEGDKNVILRVTDSSGFSCEVSKAIRAQLPLPCWKEVNPR